MLSLDDARSPFRRSVVSGDPPRRGIVARIVGLDCELDLELLKFELGRASGHPAWLFTT